MLRLKPRDLRAGMRLARSIIEGGTILLSEGTMLKAATIELLRARNIDRVYVLETGELSEKARIEVFDYLKNSLEDASDRLIANVASGNSIELESVESIIEQIFYSISLDSDIAKFLVTLKREDNYLLTHLANVTTLSLMAGQKMELTEKELRILGVGAYLHDIGMAFVPPELYEKSDALTEEEIALIKRHPVDGADEAMKIPSIELSSVTAILQHHEREDGSGYPEGLFGPSISLFAKIIAVADAYEALTSKRAYRKKLLEHEAMRMILPVADRKFSKEVMTVFLDLMHIYPVGSFVRLSDGHIARVVRTKENHFRPVVRLLRAPSGKELEKRIEVDLSSDTAEYLYITEVLTAEEATAGTGTLEELYGGKPGENI